MVVPLPRARPVLGSRLHQNEDRDKKDDTDHYDIA
jgi:hypothetical protein